MPSLSQELSPALLFFARAEGDRDFTPLPAPGVREGETFTGGGGAKYSEFPQRPPCPIWKGNTGPAPGRRGGILGYSWAGCSPQGPGPERGLSDGGVPVRLPLVPGLAGLHGTAPAPAGGEDLPSSWGTGKSLAGRPLLRTVGDCTRRAHAFYKEKGLDTVLEWNKGGHGKGVDGRWKKALAWMCRAVDEKEGGRKTR